MLLRNGKNVLFSPPVIPKKINQKQLLNACAEKVPLEIANIITDFHHCSHCYNKKQIHCNLCNMCNINKNNHLYCNICKVCYPKYITKMFQNRLYHCTLNLHIHCDVCNSVKEYCMFNMMYKCNTC